MARKRYKKKRADYRKGGRVKYAHGGRPSRRDYDSGDEYQVALEQWRNDPAHQGTSKAPVKTAASKPVQQPVSRPAPVQQPPQRQAPYRSFDPDDRDLRGTIGNIAPKLGSIAFPSDMGTGTPAPSTPSRPATYLNIPFKGDAKTPYTVDAGGMMNMIDQEPIQKYDMLDPEQAFAFEQAQQEASKNIESKGIIEGLKDTIVKNGPDFAIDLATNPASTIVKTAIEKGPSFFGAFLAGVGDLFRGLFTNEALANFQQDLADQAIAAGFTPEQVAQARDEARETIKAEEAAAAEAGSGTPSFGTKGYGIQGTTSGKAKGQVAIGEGLAAASISPAAYLYSGVGSSFESSRDAYTESGQYDIDKAKRDAEFDAMRQKEKMDAGTWKKYTPEETQQLLAEQRARIGSELAGGTMSPAATTPVSNSEAFKNIGGGQDTGSTGGTDNTGGTGGIGVSGDNLSRQRAIDIVEGTAQGPQIPAPTDIDTSLGITPQQDIQTISSPLPSGYSFEPPADGIYTQVMPSEGMKYAYGPNGERIEVPIDTSLPATATDIAAPMSMDLQDATLTQAQQQAMLPAAQMEAAQVGTETLIAGQQGAIGDDALAKAAQVDRVAPIQAATVEIPEGALTQRVVGTLSPNATAIAAQAAGTTLSRVTRAKKQLRNAGISEQAITDLGNNPEALEDRLMDLTEQERGVIGDLPEEALVSNQLDSLLKGMESGEIPTWASPAVAAVEQMLAQRGLSASTVGRDNLFNAIIQSAVPIAQSNAQAIQQSVAQSREIESREEIFNAQARQQTALQNASNVFQMDMAQFSADQQTALSNSKFLQTVSLTEASNRQQTAIQNAAITAQMNLADADFYQKAQIQNAQAFLGMDMANLSNSQQATILSAQINQQSMLSNQSAINAARQFNATSENQTQQFMAGLSQQIELTNTAAANSISQFNAQQANAAAATEFQVEADLNKAKAAMETDINKFNSQLAFNRNQWNAANAQAVEQSNIAWRRQANTINTAAANQVAMQNAMNAFNLNGQSLAFLWQELRDQAAFDFQAVQNEEDRTAQIYIQSLANQASSAASMAENIRTVGAVLSTMWSGTSKTQYTASDKAGG